MALLSGSSVFGRQPSSALEHLQQSDLSLPMPTLLLPCLALLFLPLRPPHICIQHVHFYVVVIRTTVRGTELVGVAKARAYNMVYEEVVTTYHLKT
ncbi:hypothetical protein DAPPUDRAFT_238818 [Daphnia pulex]|uniref:Uncharacterized protein n=1 Tax=Daphnia pulex TaxID=6669 RepID=E9G7H3_DAPPU|nr:hypothetical protein DAPPUDRAFT_238818 [Daphnia pulex]|eukprot:EFX84641.1 hypothetical protein DAPPUDRAFT_238818 [Daphnia pulex]